MIEAAGGVVWRTTRKWNLEVLLVHRPRRNDWSLPKGKRRRAESHDECALREVREETGLWCVLGEELPGALYLDRKDRPKSVRYWAMQETAGRFRPNREVDRVLWVRIDRVDQVLTYEHDLIVVDGLIPAIGSLAEVV